ncbi:EamA domain-containing membrane protein RarD [Acinetobacter calcoaceticus]|uniref:EamA domain-containing membrane protein RarD n=1 Tax=Acinetobacter calcoaceticus TaxID=471 RepID=A0A4R1XPK4_ACICA|nr:EamA domain-containing membrane protein RarD [Acinetobacter calcoaceticus]
MNNKNKIIMGILFALSAAILNATVGILSKLLMSSGLTAQDIAFFKTIIAVIALTLLFLRTPSQAQRSAINPQKTPKVLFLHIAICAFLGIFSLFFFETIAYHYGAAPSVVVILMASAAISALIFGNFLLKERIYVSAIIGTLCAIIGIFIISWPGGSHRFLLINAALAGTGYGVFSVLVKKFQLNGGIFLTKYLLIFGAVYLFIPFILNLHPIKLSLTSISGLIALAIFPTILGFYCTTKALIYLNAAKVQVTELSEPIFAVILSWMIFDYRPSSWFIFGAIFILLGIMFIHQIHLSLFRKNNSNI